MNGDPRDGSSRLKIRGIISINNYVESFDVEFPRTTRMPLFDKRRAPTLALGGGGRAPTADPA